MAMLLGGGGSSAPRSELLCELVMALIAGVWIVTRRPDDRPIPAAALMLAGLVVMLPIVQLIPLPPGLWQQLPGRAIERDMLALTGAGEAWMPWTMAPARTAAALCAMLPPAFVLCIAASLDVRGRRAMLMTIATLGFVSLLLGALQLADGTERSWRFYVDNPGYLNGFQANRNAEVDVLMIALAAFACLLPRLPNDAARRLPNDAAWRLSRGLLPAVGCLALLLGCVLTGSRAGILIACLVVAVLLLPWRKEMVQPRRVALVALGLVLAFTGLTWIGGGALGQVEDRFTWTRDLRLDLWRDTLPALRAVWPLGGGIGTFRPLFEAAEPLSSIDPTLPVRAHDDYLEWLLEGGVAAIAVLGIAATVLANALRRARYVAAPGDRQTVVFIGITCAIIALHSLVDYPLRSVSLATLLAANAGMLLAIVRDGVEPARGRKPSGEELRG